MTSAFLVSSTVVVSASRRGHDPHWKNRLRRSLLDHIVGLSGKSFLIEAAEDSLPPMMVNGKT